MFFRAIPGFAKDTGRMNTNTLLSQRALGLSLPGNGGDFKLPQNHWEAQWVTLVFEAPLLTRDCHHVIATPTEICQLPNDSMRRLDFKVRNNRNSIGILRPAPPSYSQKLSPHPVKWLLGLAFPRSSSKNPGVNSGNSNLEPL